MAQVKTRFLILSDTHGMEFTSETKPTQPVDVAVHCGDLTEGSMLKEIHTSIQLLKEINSPLKLVIPGNHDFTLDVPVFKSKVADARPPLDPALVKKEYGDYGEVKELFEEAADAGIVLLDEGTHHFTLTNGASLKVYASPFTPSLGDWGFQYHLERGGHDFDVPRGVDIVITHGPPKGIMDYTSSSQRAGCSSLFKAVARARPRIHCFGHIHEGWGAKLVTWRDTISESPSHFTDIDNGSSVLVEKLSGLKQSGFDSPDSIKAKLEKVKNIQHERYYKTSHCSEDTNPLKEGVQTLFINASIKGTDDYPVKPPWLVDIELSKAD